MWLREDGSGGEGRMGVVEREIPHRHPVHTHVHTPRTDKEQQSSRSQPSFEHLASVRRRSPGRQHTPSP